MAADIPSFGEKLDAFMRPPRVFEVGYRYESADGEILIVTSVETWPWRTVIRGVTTNRRIRPGTPFESGTIDASQPPGIGESTAKINAVDVAERGS